jgi:2-oxoisovalerate dehydrogenase E1 component alpha subunit
VIIKEQRVLDDRDGKQPGEVLDASDIADISSADMQRLLSEMLRIRWVDERLLRFQRQGRIGFYLTATGEEATHIGPTYALRPDDWIYPCYREIGAAFFRGYDLRTFLCQLFGNAEDPIQGRQMPVHHAIARIHYVSVSSPVGTQIPQAVGIGMAARRKAAEGTEPDVSLVYFGDGATSTGAFHVAANQAAVDKAPVILFCRNNGWAISTPRQFQTKTPTIAQKAVAYGIPGVLVDGNDVLALVKTTREAAARARRGEGPTLIEARTYRIQAHSTSDDPSVYRDPEDPRGWQARDPIDRFRAFLTAKGLWSSQEESDRHDAFDAEFREALAYAEAVAPKPPLRSMFEDVLEKMPWHLEEQYRALSEGYAQED